MQCRFAITISFVDICAFLYQCFDQPDFQLDDSQVQWTAVDATAHVHVNFFGVDQDLGCSKLFVSDSQAQWCAVVFIEDVRISVALQQTFKNTIIAFSSCIMKGCSLSIVFVIDFKIVHRVVLKEYDEHALVHVMSHKQVK